MLKNFSILLFSGSLLASTTLSEGDIAFGIGNYVKAVIYYEKEPKRYQKKLLTCYLRLGDNFFKVQEYRKALFWYKKLSKLDKNYAKIKISKVYAKQADLYLRAKKYKDALRLYKKAYKLGYKKVSTKIKFVKSRLNHEAKLKDDTRKIVTSQAPIWTKSIGRLITPTSLKILSNHRYSSRVKKCSATLVDIDSHNELRVILTASHCLSGYKKDAGNIKFIIKDKYGDMLYRLAIIYKDSHYSSKIKKNSDYAILILNTPISKDEVTPIKVLGSDIFAFKKRYRYSYASLAGFSSDVGEYGALLSFDPKCTISYVSKYYTKSSCTAYKGASGGPIVLSVSEDNISFKSYQIGVVSYFKKGDFKNIYFAPNTMFIDSLKEAIDRYNF